MEGQCKERLGFEGTRGGRRERPEQVAIARTLQTNPVGEQGDRERRRMTSLVFFSDNGTLSVLLNNHISIVVVKFFLLCRIHTQWTLRK